jgi:hypothetical protein
MALYIVAVAAFEAGPLMGLMQRVALTACYGWMIVLAWRLSPDAPGVTPTGLVPDEARL